MRTPPLARSSSVVGVVVVAAAVVGCSASRVLRSSRGDLQNEEGFSYVQLLLIIFI